MTTELTGVIAEHIAAVNAHFDVDRIMATFATDAYVNDNHREIWGADRIRRFFTREFVGDRRHDGRHRGRRTTTATSSSAPGTRAPTTRRTSRTS